MAKVKELIEAQKSLNYLKFRKSALGSAICELAEKQSISDGDMREVANSRSRNDVFALMIRSTSVTAQDKDRLSEAVEAETQAVEAEVQAHSDGTLTEEGEEGAEE